MLRVFVCNQLVCSRVIVELVLFQQSVHRILLDCFILALPLKKGYLKLLILVLLRKCKVLDVAAGKLLLKLGFYQPLLLNAFHRDVKPVVVALKLSRTGLPQSLLLRTDKLRVIRVYNTSPLLQLQQLPLRLDLSSLDQLLLGLLLSKLELLLHQPLLLLCVIIGLGLTQDLNLVSTSWVYFLDGSRLHLGALFFALVLVPSSLEICRSVQHSFLKIHFLHSSLWLTFRSFDGLLGSLMLDLKNFNGFGFIFGFLLGDLFLHAQINYLEMPMDVFIVSAIPALRTSVKCQFRFIRLLPIIDHPSCSALILHHLQFKNLLLAIVGALCKFGCLSLVVAFSFVRVLRC